MKRVLLILHRWLGLLSGIIVFIVCFTGALYAVTHRESPRAVQFYYSLPATDSDVYRVSVVHERQSYYRTDNLYYDPASLIGASLPATGLVLYIKRRKH